MKKIFLLTTFSFLLFIQSCKKNELSDLTIDPSVYSAERLIYGFPETFESGSKSSYTNGNATLSTGSWYFENAMIGTSSSDHKHGSKAARIQNTGKLSMNFNENNGAINVTIYHAKYSTESSSTWELWQSTNNGSTWTKDGSTITTSSTTLTVAQFPLNVSVPVRFQIRKISGGRLNIDDITIEEPGPDATRDDNLSLGNPSAAVTDVNSPNNYLLIKPQYVMSYNNSLGEANWVCWHLSAAWKGPAPRCNCFSSDSQLPSSFYHAGNTDFSGTGFDRGHMCPSEDRDGSSTDNAATFLMSNMIPQAPVNNQQTWADLENYARSLLAQGDELYIISGGYGTGGSGSLGGITNTIANGHINVPSHVWKIIVVLPIGSDDVNRISTATRVIAVDMPNNQTVNSLPWYNYRTTVDNIETITGFDFISNVSTTIQSTVESTVDAGPVL